jgi:rhodanese-related sulfurtransferase
MSILMALFGVIGVIPAFAQQDDLATAPRISMHDFKELKKAGNVAIVDVRSLDSYKNGHIPGAICIPSSDLQQRWKELPQDKTIVTYCS